MSLQDEKLNSFKLPIAPLEEPLPPVAEVAEPPKPVSAVLKEYREKKQMNKLKLDEVKRSRANEEYFAEIDLIDTIEDLRQVHLDKGTKFRIRNNAYLVTFRDHINKDELITCFKSKKKLWKLLKISHENPTDAFDFNHTHLVIHFSQLIDSTSDKFFDFGEHGAIMIRVLNTKGNDPQLNMAVRYLGKSDPANADLKEWGKSFVSQVLSYKSDHEAMNAMCHSAKDAQGIKLVRGMKEVEKREPELRGLGGDSFDPYPYQQLMIHLRVGGEFVDNPNWPQEQNDIIREILNRKSVTHYHEKQRAVWAFVNQIGEVGKSMIASDLVAGGLAHLIVDGGGGSINIAQNLDDAVNHGWDGECVVFDLARNVQTFEKDSIYQSIECCKNGQLNKSKYGSQTLILKQRPQIMMMMNYYPKVLNKFGNPTITIGRWNIITVDGNGYINVDYTRSIEKQLEFEKMLYEKRSKLSASHILVRRDKKGKLIRDVEEEQEFSEGLTNSGMIDSTDASKMGFLGARAKEIASETLFNL